MAITKKQIAKWNEEFKSLSKPEQRVLIAKDVIKQIKLGKYKPYSGSYIKGFELSSIDNGKLDVRENFDKINNCRCCALGACLLSVTKYKNSLTFSDINNPNSTSNIWKLLKTTFSPKQIALIERTFEGYSGTKVAEDLFDIYLNLEERNKCEKFRYKSLNSEDLLVKIMKNIIKNNGIFNP